MDRLAQLMTLHDADPADPFLTYGIALEHAKADAPDQAITWLDRTLALDADYLYAYFQKAKSQLELGDDEDARTTLDTGIQRAAAKGDAKAHGELSELRASLD